MRWTLAVVVVAGCLDNSNLPCGVTQTSPTVPGVSVAVSTTACSFPTNTPAMFNYTVSITSPVSFQMGPHGACMATLNNPSSFTSAEVTGTGGRYCPTCDLGLCAEDPGEPITLTVGDYPGALNFPGRAWDGPSDTNKPIGDALPAGPYTAKVHFEIPTGVVEADLAITLL